MMSHRIHSELRCLVTVIVRKQFAPDTRHTRPYSIIYLVTREVIVVNYYSTKIWLILASNKCIA